ncbi:MAG TPA: hypothetical protein VKB51_17155, partial [bacterium]|nr:hypothetical protein [bacterium]
MASGTRLYRAVLACTAVFLLAACGGGGAGSGGAGDNSTVYAGDPIAPGAECAFGGVRIYYGIDENGNGQLDTDERDGYEVVCNGAGSSANPITPPAGPAAQYTMKLAGGSGLGGDGVEIGYGSGGAGGDLGINLNSSGTGHIKLFATGQADASFEVPATVPTYLGPLTTYQLTVAPGATRRVESYATAAGHPTIGAYEIHTHQNDYSGTIYVANTAGNGDWGPVTGISVGAGGTLTFALGYYGYDIYVTVANDIRNEGTITVDKLAGDPLSSGNLYIQCDTFYGAPGSQILLNGVTDDTGAAGYGGYLSIDAYSYSLGISPGQGAIYNRGLIDTSGADGTNDNSGGNGGAVWLQANLALLNTGLIDTSGGDSATSYAGSGAPIVMDGYYDSTYYAHVFNSGVLDSHGGNGFQGGGDSGYVEIISRGDLRNSGDILGYGGNGTSNGGASGGDSGYAGEGYSDFRFTAYGGSIVNSGDILIHGGSGSSEGWGGTARSLSFQTNGDSDLWDNLPAGSIVVSGNIDTSGGASLPNPEDASGYTLDGGDAGSVYLEVDGSGAPNGQDIQLLGYSSISLNGGGGGEYGGTSGSLYAGNHIATVNTASGADTVYGPAGGVYNYVSVKARGGKGGTFDNTYTGGAGGAFELSVDADHPSLAPWQIAANYAAVDLTGGDAYAGGNSGAVAIIAASGAQNHGSLTLNPGLSLYDGAGHGSGTVFRTPGVYILSALGPAINTATITAKGGATAYQGNGSPGNTVQISGTLAVHSGPLISVRG